MTEVINRGVLDEMAEMMGGMTEIVDDIVATYLSESPPLVSAIADADSSTEDVRIAAHTLKSSSRAVGAIQVGDLSEAIETAARDDAIGDVSEQRGQIQAAFDQAAELLGDWQSLPA